MLGGNERKDKSERGKVSDWEREREEFFRKKGMEMRGVEERREEGSMVFGALEERDRSLQREER